MEAWRTELYHYGIKGMKWGVRRYQNYNGSLTAAGRDRYSAKIANQRAKLNRLYDTRGPLSNAYRKQARALYVTKQQQKLHNARKSGNKADVLVAKSDLKMAKLFKRYGTGDYTAPNREIYGPRLTENELQGVKILEERQANSIPSRIRYVARDAATNKIRGLALGAGLGAAVFALKKYGSENINNIGQWANKGADFIQNNPQGFAQVLAQIFLW